MGRFTERDEFGNADIIGVESACLQENLNCKEFNKVTNALNKLADYEDLEEQGKLLKLNCSVGDIVFRINRYAINPIIKMEITEICLFNIGVDRMATQIKCKECTDGGEQNYLFDDIGKIVFLTYEDAEAKLGNIRKWGIENANRNGTL